MGNLIYMPKKKDKNIKEQPEPVQLQEENDTPGTEPVYETPSEGGEINEPWGSIITMFPKPIIPCYFCDSDQVGLVRFLNAAAGYPPFLVYINDQMTVNGLSNGDMTQYGRVSAKVQMITITDDANQVYLRKEISISLKGSITMAIINTEDGLDVMEISDMLCNGGINTGCFRVCNLSLTNQRINVMLNGGSVVFQEVDYKQVTNFQYATTRYYVVYVSSSNTSGSNILLTSNLYVRGNVSYTLYVFNWTLIQNAIRVLIVEDRRS
ncbi:DUF4397 domain-containing protein [Clostridium sp. HBUAS56010]|uniref:DUF4397 domain-containing protein n=1 Tax=Clostridium sp. HBUAS56010 TaxID=2571127 RepID=UPI001177F2C1|nr:DUF4397 domain-containing protein [Clostridium sp. HBUAS56010]